MAICAKRGVRIKNKKAIMKSKQKIKRNRKIER
jgi:hypothetical protein